MNIQKLRRQTARIPKNIERKELENSEAKLEAEIKKMKLQIIDGIKAKADLETVQNMQRQLDALDVKLAEKHQHGGSGRTIETLLAESDDVARLLRDRQGTCIINVKGADCLLFERKTTIDSAAVGSQVTGVLQIDRTPGIVQEARQELRIRNLLTSRPTSLGVIDFLKVNSAPAAASMQTESSAKVENAVTFTSASEKVQTIATWIPASKQVLDDMSELMGYLRNTLPYEVDLREETQLLHGSGTGNDLHGIVSQATAFNTALLSLSPGWTKSDIVSCAIQQIQVAKETQPTFIVLHPTDYWQIRRTKNSQGNYLFAGGNSSDPFWGLQPVVTVNMGSGNFLIGTGSPVATEIRDRMEMQLEISTQHSDYYVRNLVAIRAERRLALVTYRAGAFIFGSFTTSPA